MFQNPDERERCALLRRICIVNEPAAERARAAGMTVVMDRCIYRDYRAFGL